MIHWRERLKDTCTTWLPGTRQERWIFGTLVLLATGLRMWDLPHIPFMHDEISALLRLYPTLGETLQKGVIELDTHPPGVQVFEWLWTRAFGSAEPVIKLPFMLMSIASLFFLYRSACAWTNTTVALIAAALMATLQFFVLYGQIARPYAVGLFTTAVMVDQLTRYVANGRIRELLWSMVSAVLSAYAHHFALMQVVLIGGTGLFLISREQRRPYLISCGIAVLAYVPNVPIFLHQLSQGGLSDWLRPPDRHWLGDYAWWIAHCSWLMAGVLVTLLAYSLVQRIRNGRSGGPFPWIALLWGLVPLAIGYGYSVWRAPVLQYSMLIFSFPYLLILLLSGIRPLSWKPVAGMVFGVAAVSVFTLITVRLHYQLFYRSKYEALVREGLEAHRSGEGRTLVLLDAPDHVIRFYMERWGISSDAFPYVQLRDDDARQALGKAMSDRFNSAFLGLSNGALPEGPARVFLAFPNLMRRRDYAEGQTLLFARGLPDPNGDLLLIASARPGQVQGPWIVAPDLPTDSHASWYHGGREFGIELSAGVDTLLAHDADQLIVAADVISDAPFEVRLIAELKSDTASVFYRGDELRASEGGHPSTLVVALSPADTRIRSTPLHLKTYIWNEGRGDLHVRSIDLFKREANPVQYGFFEPIRGDWKYR